MSYTATREEHEGRAADDGAKVERCRASRRFGGGEPSDVVGGELPRAHISLRIAQRSGKSCRVTVLQRYCAPDEPPVPGFAPIVRSAIFTWR